MNTCKTIIRIFVICGICLPPAVLAGKSIWTDKNIYSSGENLKVGDIIAVRVVDVSQMRFTIDLSDRSNFVINSNPDTNLTGFLPKVNSNRSVRSDNSTNMRGRGNLNFIIGARITRRLNDGTFQVAGTREYSFNGAASRFTVSGLIDPASVKGRSVESSDIANFRLEIRGLKEAPGIDIRREKLKEKETASTALTEEEKQRIIIEYLNRMLRELSR